MGISQLLGISGVMDTRGVGGRILYYEDGEVIFEEDSTGNEIYIIESGKVEISQHIDGRKIVLAVLEKGDIFGEMAMFNDAPRSVTAATIGRTTLMAFCMEEMLYLMQTNLQFALNVLQSLIDRLHGTTSTLNALIAKIHEFSDGFMAGVVPGKRSLKIGEILMEMGYLTKLQLERTLQKQKEIHMLEHRHKLIGEIMVESGIITDEQLRNALAEQRMRLRHLRDQGGYK